MYLLPDDAEEDKASKAESTSDVVDAALRVEWLVLRHREEETGNDGSLDKSPVKISKISLQMIMIQLSQERKGAKVKK